MSVKFENIKLTIRSTDINREAVTDDALERVLRNADWSRVIAGKRVHADIQNTFGNVIAQVVIRKEGTK